MDEEKEEATATEGLDEQHNSASSCAALSDGQSDSDEGSTRSEGRGGTDGDVAGGSAAPDNGLQEMFETLAKSVNRYVASDPTLVQNNPGSNEFVFHDGEEEVVLSAEGVAAELTVLLNQAQDEMGSKALPSVAEDEVEADELCFQTDEGLAVTGTRSLLALASRARHEPERSPKVMPAWANAGWRQQLKAGGDAPVVKRKVVKIASFKEVPKTNMASTLTDVSDFAIDHEVDMHMEKRANKYAELARMQSMQNRERLQGLSAFYTAFATRFDEEWQAAITIQTLWRGQQARKRVQGIRRQIEINRAADRMNEENKTRWAEQGDDFDKLPANEPRKGPPKLKAESSSKRVSKVRQRQREAMEAFHKRKAGLSGEPVGSQADAAAPALDASASTTMYSSGGTAMADAVTPGAAPPRRGHPQYSPAMAAALQRRAASNTAEIGGPHPKRSLATSNFGSCPAWADEGAPEQDVTPGGPDHKEVSPYMMKHAGPQDVGRHSPPTDRAGLPARDSGQGHNRASSLKQPYVYTSSTEARGPHAPSEALLQGLQPVNPKIRRDGHRPEVRPWASSTGSAPSPRGARPPSIPLSELLPEADTPVKLQMSTSADLSSSSALRSQLSKSSQRLDTTASAVQSQLSDSGHGYQTFRSPGKCATAEVGLGGVGLVDQGAAGPCGHKLTAARPTAPNGMHRGMVSSSSKPPPLTHLRPASSAEPPRPAAYSPGSRVRVGTRASTPSHAMFGGLGWEGADGVPASKRSVPNPPSGAPETSGDELRATRSLENLEAAGYRTSGGRVQGLLMPTTSVTQRHSRMQRMRVDLAGSSHPGTGPPSPTRVPGLPKLAGS